MNVPAQPWPNVLPQELEQLVDEIARITQAPRELIISILICALAATVQRRCRVQRRSGLDGPVGVYLISICDSGERKSAVQKLLFKALTEVQRLWSEEATHSVAAHRVEHALWREKVDALRDAMKRAVRKEESIDEIEKQLRVALEAEPQPSLALKLIYSDTTIEALLEGLHERGNSAVMVHDEFAQFCDGPMSRQLGALNALWSGSDWSVDRKTSGSFVLHDSSLTCLLQAQPVVFKRFVVKQGEQALGNGFFARVLVCWPYSTQGQRFENGSQGDYTKLNWFYDRCKTLLERSESRLLKFSPQAQAHWNGIANSYEASMQPGGLYCAAKDFASKAAENIARVAAIFHSFLVEDSDEISSETLQYAINLISYYGEQYLNIFGKFNPVTEQQRDLADLEDWILTTQNNKQWNCIPKAYILQYGPNRLRDKAKLDLLLDILASSFRITIAKVNKKTVVYANTTVVAPQYYDSNRY